MGGRDSLKVFIRRKWREGIFAHFFPTCYSERSRAIKVLSRKSFPFHPGSDENSSGDVGKFRVGSRFFLIHKKSKLIFLMNFPSSKTFNVPSDQRKKL